MDRLELKVPASDLESHLRAVRHISNRDKAAPLRLAKKNKAPKSQQTLSAGKQELQAITSVQIMSFSPLTF